MVFFNLVKFADLKCYSDKGEKLFLVATNTRIAMCTMSKKETSNTRGMRELVSLLPHYSAIKLPYANNGIQIAPYGRSTRLVAKLMEMELVVMWNNEDYLMVSKMLL